jgi:hypothetical protein
MKVLEAAIENHPVFQKFQSPCGEGVMKAASVELCLWQDSKFQSPCGEGVMKVEKKRDNPSSFCYSINLRSFSPLAGKG